MSHTHSPDHPHPETPAERISCETCCREVPRDEAVSAEASDYILYFCGVACFNRWQGGAVADRDDRD